VKSIRALAFKVMDPNPGKEQAMNRTIRVFRRAVNFYLHKIGERPDRISNKNMPDAYEEAKEAFPEMNTALLQQAGRVAIEGYKSYDENEDNSHFPHFDSFVPVRYDNAVLVMEKLDGIRDNVDGSTHHNRRLHNWTFAQLQQFVEYKCHVDGVAYRKVPAFKTSQVCTDCGGFIRRCSSQAVAVCEACKKEVNADLLGATNVVRRLFFYMGSSTEPCESGSNGSNPVDRGYDETKGLSAVDEKLLDKQLRSSAPRSLLQTEAVA